MMEDYRSFWKFIELLGDNKILPHILIIGSWAEYLIQQAGILPDYQSNLKTLDIDVLIKNKNMPLLQKSLLNIAESAGYLINHDRLTGASKIYMVDDSLEIEFLIGQRGSGETQILSTNLGVNAQALRHIDILTRNEIKVELFGFTINIPEPAAYVIHKMVINKTRKGKAEKDKESIFNMYPHVNRERFNEIAATLSKSERKAFDDFIHKFQLLTDSKP